MDDRTRPRNVLQHILGRGLFLGMLFVLSPVWVAYAQQGVIRGQVIDRDTREGLPGANIVVQGTTLGAATDIEGRYEIANVPAGTYTVSVSYVG